MVEPELKVHLPGSQIDIIVDMEFEDFLKNEQLISENEQKIQEMRNKIMLLQKEKRENKLAKIDQRKFVDSFLAQSPKKTKKSTNISALNKSRVSEKKEKPVNTNVISPPIRILKESIDNECQERSKQITATRKFKKYKVYNKN